MNAWKLLSVALLLSARIAAAEDAATLIGQKFAAEDTLADIDEKSDDARACLEGLCWKRTKFEVQCDEPGKRPCSVLVRFPSPVASGDELNDRVAMEWYFAKDEAGQPIVAPAVVVVHESGRDMAVGRMFARGLRPLGLHTFLLHLPLYGERHAEGKRPEAADLMLRMRQGVADVRRARDAVAVLPLVQKDQVYLQGTSLGGFVAATTAGLDRGYTGVFIVLAGGDLVSVIENGKKDAAKLRQRLKRAGIEGKKLKELVHVVEPNRLAHRIHAQTTWLYSGKYDDVVPPKNSASLAAAAKLAEGHHIRLAADHYSGIVYMPFMLTHIRKQIREGESREGESREGEAPAEPGGANQRE
jgi:dienelactone hydrolase